MNGPVKIFIIIFPTIIRCKTEQQFPFFPDGKYTYPDVLYLPGESEGKQVFRLAKFFCKNDFSGHRVKLKIFKK
jgi:hypothetical protein